MTHSMKRSEAVTTSLAVIAIIVSAVTAYFQFRSYYDLRASVLSVSCTPSKISAAIALLNRGNRESIVTKATLLLYKPTDRLIISESVPMTPGAANLPTILHPGEVRLIELSGTLTSEMIANYAFPPSSKLDEPTDAKVFVVGAAFRTADDTGTQYESKKDIVTWIITPSQSEAHAKSQKVFSLFQRSLR
jgi:hypothetical protein